MCACLVLFLCFLQSDWLQQRSAFYAIVELKISNGQRVTLTSVLPNRYRIFSRGRSQKFGGDLVNHNVIFYSFPLMSLLPASVVMVS